MTNFLSRLMLRPLPIEPADVAYAQAMAQSDVLLARMRAASKSNDPVRGVMADIWQQRHNVPFMTTVHEAVKEMQAPFAGTTAHAPQEPDAK